MDGSEYIKYLNSKDKQKVLNYYYIKDFKNIKVGDRIKYIIKQNLKLKPGGTVINIINNNVITVSVKKHTQLTIDNINNFILYKSSKKKCTKTRDFMNYLLEGLDNNTITIKKTYD